MSLTAKEEAEYIKSEVFQLRLRHAVLVEGKTDVPFWTAVLERAGAAGRFKIYRQVQFPAPDSSGKATLETHFLPFADRELWICIDSDHDYLLENPVWQKPFVFQTKVHSVENYQCFAPSLNAILQKGVADESAIFDFDDFLAAWSIENYPAFLDELVSKKAIAIDEKTAFQSRLEILGLVPETTYLFFRGHHLKEKTVLKLLKKVAEPITKTCFEAKSADGKAAYQKHLKAHSFEKLLTENDGFSEFHLYKSLVAEVTEATAIASSSH